MHVNFTQLDFITFMLKYELCLAPHAVHSYIIKMILITNINARF